MTVATAVARTVVSGNGSATSFAYTFKITDQTHLVVVKTDTSGNDTTLTLGTHYTVSGVGGASGGTITYPVTGSALASGEKLTMRRLVPLTQSVDLTNQGAFYAEVHETEFDQLAMADQQAQEQLNRCLMFAPSDTVSGALPNAAARANRVLTFDSSGAPAAGEYVGGAGGLFTQAGTGAVSRTFQDKAREWVSIKDFGAVGDASTDDRAAIVAALTYGASVGKPVFVPAGVYRCSNGIILPEGIHIIGSGAPRLGVFPLTADDKRYLRPGYKHLLPGSSFLFTGTGALTHTTARVDRFASFTFCMRTSSAHSVSIEGLGIVLDTDVYNSGGSLTTGATDNRAAYDVGLFTGADASYFRDVTIWGYYPDAGLVVYGADPDVQRFFNGSSMGDIGCAIIGNGTNGLSGTQFYGWSFFDNSHHSRSITLNQWGTTALYIDGDIPTATPPQDSIGGHYFFGGTVRAYADRAVWLDHCNAVTFHGVVFEWSEVSGSTGATTDAPLATADTHGVSIWDCRYRQPIGSAMTLAWTGLMGGPALLSNPRYGMMGVVGNLGRGAVLRCVDSSSNPTLQLTDDANGSTNGWTMLDNISGGELLEFRHDNTARFSIDKDGGVRNDFGFSNGGTKTIATGAIAAGTYNYYAVDTEASAASDDLDTISGGAYNGQLLVLRSFSSSRTVVCRDGVGNLRLAGHCPLANAQDRLVLQYDGSNWCEIARSLSSTGAELTIDSGVITVTRDYHRVDTQADAATDDLDTINGGYEGQRLVLRAADSTRDVVCKDGTGNLQLAGDFTLTHINDRIQLIFDGTNWCELSRSDNSA